MLKVSKLRTKKSVFLSRSPHTFPVVSISRELKTEIGGMLGLGTQKSTTVITLDRNEFFQGDKVSVRIQCDNTKCDKAVKSFKFKLFRKYQCINFRERQVSHQADILFNNKEPGLNAKEKCDKVFEVKLPMNDFANYHEGMMLMDRPGASFCGNFHYIDFSLNVFVKHDVFFGEGASVSFPVRIHQSPLKGPFHRVPADKMTLPDKGIIMEKREAIMVPQTDNRYYRMCVQRADRRWEKRAQQAVVMT